MDGPPRTDTPTSPRRTTLAGATALSTAVLPVFLVGALGEAIRDDLGLSETAVGGVVTALFLSAAVTASAAGRLAERVGAGIALRAGVAIAGVGALAVGVLGRGLATLLVPMAVVGFAVALIDTGAARAFSDRVPARVQGMAFGIKEASIPAASMLAGLSLPTVAAVLGWRASFVGATVVAAMVLALLPRPRDLAADRTGQVPVDPSARVTTPSLVAFAAGAGLGTAAATAAATFLVPSAIADGVSPAAAGIVLSVASVGAIVARVAVGRWADTEGAAPVPVVASMLGGGGVAAGALAGSLSLPLLVVAAVVALAAGWGWSGLAFLAAVRANPHAPAAAAGVVLTGLGSGGALGPLAFGALVDLGSYTVAWGAAAGSLLLGAVLTASARHALEPVPVDHG